MDKCPKCGSLRIMGVEYGFDHIKCYYDGISEWQCMDCKYRVGRWSGKELKGIDHEPPYGGKHRCI